MSAMNRKKALAARRICSYKKRGRKVRTPYLVVLQKKNSETRRDVTTHYDAPFIAQMLLCGGACSDLLDVIKEVG